MTTTQDNSGALHSNDNSSSSSASPNNGGVDTSAIIELSQIDGGLLAWLQVLGAFCLFFTSWQAQSPSEHIDLHLFFVLINVIRGLVKSFGVFQTYYTTTLLATSNTTSQISWIGSLQAFLLVSTGVLTGPIYDADHLHSLLCLGTVLTVLGLMITSICTRYWHLLVAQGLCIGLGSGCFFVPSLAAVSSCFTTKRALATGIAVSGSSIGGIVYPITFRYLEPTLGFGWTTRILAFITLLLLLLAVGVLRNDLPPRRPRTLFQPSAFKSPAFTVQSLSLMLGFVGLYIPMFYIQTYALTLSIITPTYAFYLLAILNAGSFFGRIIPNYLADTIGPMVTLLPCTVAAGILCLCWIRITNVAGITIFAASYGFFAGTYVSLIPPVIVSLTPDLSVVGTWLGMSLLVASFGLLVGTPHCWRPCRRISKGFR